MLRFDRRYLGNFVRVQQFEPGLEGCVRRGGGLENGEHLRAALDSSLPAVDGLDGGQEIHAGGELRFHEGRANLPRLLNIGKG